MNRTVQKIWDWCWLTRPTVIANIMFACTCASVLSGQGVFSEENLLLVFAVAFLAGGGFVLNDVVDIRKDQVSHPKRPIASGRVQLKTAALVGSVMIVVAVLLSMMFRNSTVLYQVLFGALLVLVYSWIRSRIGWMGNIVTATLSLLPWILPASLIGRWSVVLEPAVGSFLLVLSREILLDIHDVMGDKRAGIKTLPSLLGNRVAARISISLMFLAYLGTILVGVKQALGPWFLGIVSLGVGIPAAMITWILLTKEDMKWYKIAGNLGKVQFMFGIAAWWLKAIFV